MSATNQFFLWFYYGLNGLGGWFIFMLVALIAVVWLIYDSQNRRLPVIGWRMGVILVACLIIPAILFRFTVTDPTDITNPLVNLAEPIFYLGLLSGVLPPVIAAGYYVTYQGYVGCTQGHIYDLVLGECPECAQLAAPSISPVVDFPLQQRQSPPEDYGPPPQPKPKAQAWLASQDGRNYQLNRGETSIGRSSHNDIQLSGDTTISRQHVKIVEQNNHFRLIDLAGKNTTRVNQHIVRQPMLLEPDDEIQLGDHKTFRFVTVRH